MANTIAQLHTLDSLGALTLKLYPVAGGAIVNGADGDALTESGTTPGLYQSTVTEALSGIYAARVYSGADLLGSYVVDLRDDTGAYNLADPALAAGMTATAVDEIDAEVDGGAGGDVILNVVPSTVGVGDVSSDPITAYRYAAGSATIAAVDSEGAEVALPASVTFCVEPKDSNVDVFTKTPAPSGNEALIEWDADDVSGPAGDYVYSLRDTDTGRVYAEGVFRIKRAALADS